MRLTQKEQIRMKGTLVKVVGKIMEIQDQADQESAMEVELAEMDSKVE